jgi:outer membrane immunogenic protein
MCAYRQERLVPSDPDAASMRKLTVACTAIALVASSPGYADDYFSMLSGTSAVDWTGFYIGASVGYGWLRDIDRSFTPPLPDSGQDWIFGGHAGYLHQMGDFVVGAELEYQRLDITYQLFNFITVDNAFIGKVRAGYAFDQFLISGSVGGAYATTNFMGLQGLGLALGAGLDYRVTDTVTVGAHYQRFSYTNFSGTMIDATLDQIAFRASVGF